jgi:hypothetical protein
MALVQIPTPTVETGGMTLLSTTTLSGTATTVSNINQTFLRLLIVLESPMWNTGTDKIRIDLNNVNSAIFTAGVEETSSNTFQAVGLNGFTLTVNNGFADRSNNGSSYCAIIDQYATSAASKPVQWFGALVIGDQRSFNHAGGFLSSSAITSVVVRTENGYSFTSGTLKIYGVK